MTAPTGHAIGTRRRMARPERFRVGLREDVDSGATDLELPARRMWPVGLVFGAMFLVFAAVEWTVIAGIRKEVPRDVFDLVFMLFQGFWVLGWSVGVVVLGGLTILLLFYRESARLQGGRLVYTPRLGPVKMTAEYDLARVRNVRIEKASTGDKVRVKFDYGEGTSGLGDVMARPDAERLVAAMQRASASAGPAVETAPASTRWEARPDPEVTAPERAESDDAPPSLASASGLALVGANLVPLVGVLFFGWDLADVMILFWAESGVIGFYTVLKIAVVGKLTALFVAPFFVGHFGGFMAGHFLFIYGFFVRGIAASGPDPAVWDALASVFVPLRGPLAVLFISHGVSFFSNFIGRREFAGATVKALMKAPYDRIILMQVVLIFGGWIIMLLKSPVPALALLVLLKTALDFKAHRREHA